MNILIVVILLAQGIPFAAQEIELLTYLPAPGGWESISSGSCETDIDGHCAITARVEPWSDGLVRGALLVAGRQVRPVIFPGGRIQLTIELDEALHVDGRYDHLPADPGLAPMIHERRPSLLLLGMAVFMLLMTGVLFAQLRRGGLA